MLRNNKEEYFVSTNFHVTFISFESTELYLQQISILGIMDYVKVQITYTYLYSVWSTPFLSFLIYEWIFTVKVH